jgi:hypothetical protein
MSCTISRNLIRKNDFSTADGLYSSFEGYRHLDKVFYCDEAWFHLSGYINSQNSRIQSAENPHTFHERPFCSLKFRVWCAVS